MRLKGRPYALPPDRWDQLERRWRDVEMRLLESLEDLLAEIERPTLRARVRRLAFEPNEALPKRSRRPNVTVAFLADGVYRSYADTDEGSKALLQFAAVVHEYYDLFDDLFDGDVDAGYEAEVLGTMQVMMPLVVRLLDRLGGDAAAYWSERAIALMGGPFGELTADPSPSAYLEVVDHQSELFGFVTGVAAIAAGTDDEAVDRAAALGRACFAFEQFALDLEQYHGDDDRWNAWALLPETAAASELRSRRDAIESLAGQLPGDAGRTIADCFAVDLERLRADAAGTPGADGGR